MGNGILRLLSSDIRYILNNTEINYSGLMELRLRINEPLILAFTQGELMVKPGGGMTEKKELAYRVTCEDIRSTVDAVSDFSLYAYEDDVRQGFITVRGGHRVGMAGQVLVEKGRVKNMKHISFVNIRMSHQVKGCSNQVLPYIYKEGRPLHTLIISPPGCGKTTLLRDLVRNISEGNYWGRGINVGVVDERSEIGACYMGVPQNELGIRTDVLDGCPKSEGMLMLIRSMNPKVIALDEIGGREDIEALFYCINCGCKVLATVHGDSIDDIRNRPGLRRLVEERLFDRYIVLGFRNGVGSIENIFDERGNELFIQSLSIAN